jgi:drug/metabolite transporter (DMT)-like permease
MATVEVSTKLIQMKITPFQLNFFRTLWGNLLLLAVILASGSDLITFIRRHLLKVIVSAVLWNTIGLNLYFLAITWTAASHAALIFSSFPLVASILAIVTLNEQVTLRRIIGSLIGFTGITAVITKFDVNFLQYGTVHGDLLMIIPMLIWCIYLIWGVSGPSRKNDHSHSPFREQLNYLCSTFTFGLLFMIPIVMFDISQNSLQFSPELVIPILYLGVGTNGVAYILYFWGISRLSVSKGTMIFFLKPMLAAIIAFFILGENIFSPSFIVGISLIFLGLYITMRS